jgi:DNA-directed RNA polymerase specialized sigma subunit
MGMKIPLNVEHESNESVDARALERNIKGAGRGDFDAKLNLARTFMPLLSSLAQKRTSDTSMVNEYIEAGKAGLFKAAKKYKAADAGVNRFQLFALDFINASMDRVGKKGGLLGRLFGG